MREKLFEMNPDRQKLTSQMFASMWRYATDTTVRKYGLFNCINYEKEIEKLRIQLLDELVGTGEDVYNSELADEYNQIFMGFKGYSQPVVRPLDEIKRIVKQN